MIYVIENGALRPENQWVGFFAVPDELAHPSTEAFLVAWAGRDSGRARLLLAAKVADCHRFCATPTYVLENGGPVPMDFVQRVDIPNLHCVNGLWSPTLPSSVMCNWRPDLILNLKDPLAPSLFERWEREAISPGLAELVKKEWSRR